MLTQTPSTSAAPSTNTIALSWYDDVFKNRVGKQNFYETLISNPHVKEVFTKAGITAENFPKVFDAAVRDTYPTAQAAQALYLSIAEESSFQVGPNNTLRMRPGFAAVNIKQNVVVDMLNEMAKSPTFKISPDGKFSGQATVMVDTGASSNNVPLKIDFDKKTISPEVKINPSAAPTAPYSQTLSTDDIQTFFKPFLNKGRDGLVLINQSADGKFALNSSVTVGLKGINMAVADSYYDAKKGDFDFTTPLGKGLGNVLAHEFLHGLYLSHEPYRKEVNSVYLKTNGKSNKLGACQVALGFYDLDDPDQKLKGLAGSTPGHMGADEFFAYLGGGSFNLVKSKSGSDLACKFNTSGFNRDFAAHYDPELDFSKLGKFKDLTSVTKAIETISTSDQGTWRIFNKLNESHLADSIAKFRKEFNLPVKSGYTIYRLVSDTYNAQRAPLVKALTETKNPDYENRNLLAIDPFNAGVKDAKDLQTTLDAMINRYAPAENVRRLIKYQANDELRPNTERQLAKIFADHGAKNKETFAKAILTGFDIEPTAENVSKTAKIFSDFFEGKQSKGKLSKAEFIRDYSRALLEFATSPDAIVGVLDKTDPKLYKRLVDSQNRIADILTGRERE